MGLMGTKLKLSREYSLEELFEKIQNETFEAGEPSLASHGVMTYIVFPQIDRNNQVVIGNWKGTFYVQRTVQPIGIDKAVTNIALEHLTGGISGISSVLGKNKKLCNQLVEKTADQINAMNL